MAKLTEKDLPRLAAAMNGPLRAAAGRGVASAAQAVLALVMRETSRKKALNIGTYKNAWKAVRVDAVSWRVANATPYAAVIEYGRRPGKGVPIGPLRLWVIRKLQEPEATADRVAMLISRRIKRRGLPARRVLSDVVDGGKVQSILNREVRREVQAEVQRILAAGGVP